MPRLPPAEARNRAERRAAASEHPFGWEPWARGAAPAPMNAYQVAALADRLGITLEQAQQAADLAFTDTIWINNVYQVAVRAVAFHERPAGHEPWMQVFGLPGLIHLSIKRRDRKPVGVERFRHFQAIKNDLVGPEHEAAELYPAEARLADMAHQYHLWCVPIAEWRFPFGFLERFVIPFENQPTGVDPAAKHNGGWMKG